VDCDLYEERIMEYLDGELDARQEKDLKQHLSKCASCSEFFSAMQMEYKMLSELPLLSPEQDFTQKVVANVLGKKAAVIPQAQAILAVFLAAVALALYIPGFWDPADLVPVITNAAGWFATIAKGVGSIFNTALWVMDLTAKVFLDLQSALYFLEKICVEVLKEYPLSTALVMVSFIVEAFLWGRLLSPRKSYR